MNLKWIGIGTLFTEKKVKFIKKCFKFLFLFLTAWIAILNKIVHVTSKIKIKESKFAAYHIITLSAFQYKGIIQTQNLEKKKKNNVNIDKNLQWEVVIIKLNNMLMYYICLIDEQ